MMKVSVSKDKQKGKITGYRAYFAGIEVAAPTKEEAISHCERLVFAQCELESYTVLTFGRYVVTVGRYRPGQYEYTIIDASESRKYGRVFTSCLFQAEHIKEAISVSCISVAQRVVDDGGDTELMAAVLSYMTEADAAEFHSWVKGRKRLAVAAEQQGCSLCGGAGKYGDEPPAGPGMVECENCTQAVSL